MSRQRLEKSFKKPKQRIKRREISPSAVPVVQDEHPFITQLQRTVGNHCVAQMIQTKRLTSDGRPKDLQPKLTVGAANDPYEQESEQVASQVINMPEVAVNSMQRAISPEEDKKKMLQTKPLAASITKFVQRQPESEEEKKDPIQPKSARALSESFEAGNDIETQLSLSKGRGTPLPDQMRTFMEPRFGVDFSHVNVHTGSDAITMNRDVGAQAFTYGSDIYYGKGRSPNNMELTAHELTHVVQQRGGTISSNRLTAFNQMGHNIRQTSTQQLSRQGLLNAGQETAAINFNNARYDERSIRIIQIISGTGVDGQFGTASAEAAAGFQNTNGLGIDGKVGEDTLNAMVADRVTAGLHEHAIQLVIDFNNLNVTRDTLTVHFDPALAVAGAAAFESGNLRVIRIGPTGFASAAVLRATIIAQLTTPAPAPASVVPRPTHLTNAAELSAIQANKSRFNDRRSVLAIQGIVGSGLDGVIGRDTVERIAEFQDANGLNIDGKIGDGETLPVIVNQLIGANNQDSAIRLIIDFYNLRDAGNLLDVFFDPTVAANASTDFRPNEPVRVRVGPSGLAQPFAGIVHTIAHEYEHVRRLKEGIVSASTHEFLGEATEILSVGTPEEDLETVAPGSPGFVAGFADDAGRALVNWNLMPLADQRSFRNRFIAVRQRVRDRIAAGTPAQGVLHAPLLAGYNAVVLPPP
jgi:peptidoglycan hydrolase-like protein with peptidoglycan-binding domain